MAEANEASRRSGSPFLTVAEVADMLRVSNMTVYRLVNAGAMKAVRIGKSYRITEAEVDRYLREGAATAETG
jgi:excisionase family DNA binding protein